MAKLTGGGFTNLPADRGTLVAKLDAVATTASRASEDTPGGDLYVFVLEDPKTEADPRHLPGVRRRSASSSPSTPIISAR